MEHAARRVVPPKPGRVQGQALVYALFAVAAGGPVAADDFAASSARPAI